MKELTNPMPGRRALLKRWLGIVESKGFKESSSFHRTVNAGSLRALHVRAIRETERRPVGVSRMNSSRSLVVSGSLRMDSIVVCR